MVKISREKSSTSSQIPVSEPFTTFFKRKLTVFM